MTDPRIEAAIDAWVSFIEDASLEKTGKEIKINDGEILHSIRQGMTLAIAAADAAVWRPTTTPPDVGVLVLIMSSSETGSEQAIALWDYDMGCWRNPDIGMRYAPAYFIHWQPLPNPPTPCK